MGWKDTGKRTKKAVCCQGGQYKSCDEVFAELEGGAADDSSSGNTKNTKNSKNVINGESGKGNGGKDSNSQNGGNVSFPGNEEAARLQNIEEKLKMGEKLSKSEIKEIRSKISSLRSSAELLNQTATELEMLLENKL